MKHTIFVFILISLSIANSFSQAGGAAVLRLDTIPHDGILLDKGWKFHAGDDPARALPQYDDSDWEDISPNKDFFFLPQVRKQPIGWVRIKLHLDSSLINQPLALQVCQTVASEYYLNGKLIKKFGVIGDGKSKTIAVNPFYKPLGIQFDGAEQVLAIRFAIQDNLPYVNFIQAPNTFIEARINDISGASRYEAFVRRNMQWVIFTAGFFILFAIIHFGYFLLYRRQKASLFFAIAVFAAGASNILVVSAAVDMEEVQWRTYFFYLFTILGYALYNLFLLLAIHWLFAARRNAWFWFLLVYLIAGIFLPLFVYKSGLLLGMAIPVFLCTVEMLRLSWQAKKQGKKGVGIITGGLIFYFVTAVTFTLMYFGVLPNPRIGDQNLAEVLNILTGLSIPLALSAYLAREYAATTIHLEKELLEVKKLSDEKQQILAAQNETLEQQVTERTAALNQSLQHLTTAQAQLIQTEKMASLGELTAGIAHEIQNPLNFVNNFSELNTELIEELNAERNKVEGVRNADLEDELIGDIKQNMEKIAHHGKRADAIVKGMLQHSRSSSGIKEPTDINKLADEYLRLAYHGLRAKDKDFNATLKTGYDESIGNINIVPQDIGRVMLNLITNAFYATNGPPTPVRTEVHPGGPNGGVKAAPKPGYEPTVWISTKKVGDKVLISVKDNGGGIPQHIIGKIFQPFFTTKPTGQGTGLGLSLAYDIVKAHRGEIKVESKEGQGCEFVIQLPV